VLMVPPCFASLYVEELFRLLPEARARECDAD